MRLQINRGSGKLIIVYSFPTGGKSTFVRQCIRKGLDYTYDSDYFLSALGFHKKFHRAGAEDDYKKLEQVCLDSLRNLRWISDQGKTTIFVTNYPSVALKGSSFADDSYFFIREPELTYEIMQKRDAPPLSKEISLDTIKDWYSGTIDMFSKSDKHKLIHLGPGSYILDHFDVRKDS